jgi:hypothetical protein
MKKIKIIMGLNAISCLIFGAAFLFFSHETAQFLSGNNKNSVILLTLGISLIFNGIHIFFSIYRSPKKIEVIYFSVGDFLWVIGTLVTIYFEYLVITSTGIWAAFIVGAMVGTFGVLQLKQVKSLTK